MDDLARWMSLVLAGPGCEREVCCAGKNRNMTTLHGTCSVGTGINQCLVSYAGGVLGSFELPPVFINQIGQLGFVMVCLYMVALV